jgi:hypothetical protein
MKKKCSPIDFIRLARQRNGELPLLRQCLEAVILFAGRGVGLGYYQMAGFWRRDLPWNIKVGQLSAKEYRAVDGALNPAAYRKLSQYKVAEKALLRLFNVPCSEYLGLYSASNGCSAEGDPLKSPQDLANFLSGLPELARVCFKPPEGWGGKGFEIVQIKDKDGIRVLKRAASGETMEVAEFCRSVIDRLHGGNSVIERYLEQHPAMARFNPSSVNTLRFWVLQRHGSRPEVILGYLRIGRKGMLVDNQSSGGIVAPLDLGCGRLSKAIDGLPTRHTFPVHPDHGAPIEGESIPFFGESIALATRCLLPFAPLCFAGLDIAITADGPRVIELNVFPDREGAAFTDTPTRDLFSRL